MKLFIQDEAFFGIDPSNPTPQHVEIRLSMAITEPDIPEPPATTTTLDFVLDTGADDALVFPNDLLDFGIIPEEGVSGGKETFILADGSKIELSRRDVTLWLYSNIPGLEDQPYPIDLNGGVVVFPDPDPGVNVSPLLGMNPLLDAALKIEINAQTQQFSVWVPDDETPRP